MGYNKSKKMLGMSLVRELFLQSFTTLEIAVFLLQIEIGKLGLLLATYRNPQPRLLSTFDDTERKTKVRVEKYVKKARIMTLALHEFSNAQFITSGGKSTMANCSLSSGTQPKASTAMKVAVPVRLYNNARFSLSDSINGWPC